MRSYFKDIYFKGIHFKGAMGTSNFVKLFEILKTSQIKNFQKIDKTYKSQI